MEAARGADPRSRAPRTPRVAVTTWRRRLSTTVADDQLLYTLAADYVECLRDAGVVPLLLPLLEPAEAAGVLGLVDGVVVTGGDDVDPAEYGHDNHGSRNTDRSADRSDAALLRTAAALRLPTLAICRGLQVLNVAFGGSLRQEVTGASRAHPLRPDDKAAGLAHRHAVEFVEGSRIAGVYDRHVHRVTSLHHQGVDRLGDGLRATAHAPDGLPEALEPTDPGWWCVGVQWHPEKMGGEDAVLFDAFAAQVRRG
jgi:putative glutamine amidotransferase